MQQWPCMQEILIRAYFVLLLYAYYVRRSIARKFEHVHVTKLTEACCIKRLDFSAILRHCHAIKACHLSKLLLYAKAVSALFSFFCLIRRDKKLINMKKYGNFHFPTRLKISYIINNLKDIYGIFWRMRVKNASRSLSETIGVSEETSWVRLSCW